MSIYPEHATERDRWILARRGARNKLDPFKPHAFLAEEERAESGEIVSVATIFLTNRECPWRCVMCDLWKSTLTETVPPGAIPAQIDYALAELSKQRSAGFQTASSGDIRVAGDCRESRGSREVQPAVAPRQMSLKRHSPSPRPSLHSPTALTPDPSPIRWERGTAGEGERSAASSPFSSSPAQLKARMPALRQIKLYNSGSFFDPRAVPPEDHEAIAQRVAAFDRVIVECHPALIGESTLKFRDWLGGTACSRPISGEFMDGATPSLPDEKLEVAMGLETAHPQVLEKLNKRMTLDQFRRAAEFLRENGIALRVFILVKPPFLDETEALLWARRSIDFAFDCGATVASLIPTRFGNGALEMLAERGEFSPPKLATLEAALDYGVGLNRGRVFADLWDLETFSDCAECFEQRRTRLLEMNLRQVVLPRVPCVSGFGRPSGTGICDND